jgi:Holliday junction DNA helicase RuvA
VYEFIRGVVASRGEGAVALDVGGVGYRLLVSISTYKRVPPSGEATLYTHLLVRDDAHILFGFFDRAERHLFRQLLQVSGVGPAAALGLLSTYEPEALASHIASGELGLLTKVKGIGKRTGERILVELRDKFVATVGSKSSTTVPAGAHTDAVLALCSLGLPRVEAEKRVAAVKGDLELEEIVKQALRA